MSPILLRFKDMFHGNGLAAGGQPIVGKQISQICPSMLKVNSDFKPLQKNVRQRSVRSPIVYCLWFDSMLSLTAMKMFR